jgi:F-type H+-transporting ATPase subunit a
VKELGLSMLASASPLEHVVQHPIVEVDADLGNSLLNLVFAKDGVITILSDQITALMIAAILLIFLFPGSLRKRRGTDTIGRLIPIGFANAVEAVCDYIRKDVARPALGEQTDRFIKYVWSVFFFVLTVNLLGLVPIPAVSTVFGAHVGGTATANIYATATLALMTMFMMVFNGIRLGGMAYLAHFCPGPIALAPLLVPVEIIGLIAKIFALAVRLFANMMAGHTLLAVLIGFILSAWTALGAGGGLLIAIPVVLGSVAITFLEIFVAFLQAYIFMFLTTMFIGLSVNVHHDEDHGEEAHAH